MPKGNETHVSSMRIRRRDHGSVCQETKSQVEWIEPEKKRIGESFYKNIAVASALVLCAVTLRTGAIPPLNDAADAVLTAATDQSLLDEQLGKLSFVSALFPEATLVFGESSVETFAVPVSGGVVVHAWSEQEPYMSWRTSSQQVISVSAGEVMGVFHGNGDERVVQVRRNDGLTCLYGNLSDVFVQPGDQVHAGTCLGDLLPDADCVFELREDGRSIDPGSYFAQ